MASRSWRVLAEAAFDKWVAETSPDESERLDVLDWLLRFAEQGPPDDALPVPFVEDVYLSRIPGRDIAVEYLALAYERRAVVREIRPL